MVTVAFTTIWAMEYTLLSKLGSKKTQEALFKELGVTNAQWRTQKLRVRQEVKSRLELVASFHLETADMKLLPVMLKILEARDAKS